MLKPQTQHTTIHSWILVLIRKIDGEHTLALNLCKPSLFQCAFKTKTHKISLLNKENKNSILWCHFQHLLHWQFSSSLLNAPKMPKSFYTFWAWLLKFKTISSKYIFFLVKPAVSPQSHLPLTSHTLSGLTHFSFPNCQRLIFLKIFTSINETKHSFWGHKSKKSKHWGPLLWVIYKMTWWPFFFYFAILITWYEGRLSWKLIQCKRVYRSRFQVICHLYYGHLSLMHH